MNLINPNNIFTKLFVIGFIALVTVYGCKKDEEEEEDTRSQSGFCYSLTNSTVAFDTINGGTDITTMNSDDFYVVDLGFSFTFCGTSFQTLYIGWDYTPTFSYVVNSTYTDATGYELIPFGTMTIEPKWGTLPSGGSGYLSSLKYSTIGSAGDKITTIEYIDFIREDFSSGLESTFSFQIKLYENGNKVSYHYGPNDFTLDFTTLSFDLLTVGLYSIDGNEGLYLSGNYSAPTTQPSPGSNELTFWPANGTLYTFQ